MTILFLVIACGLLSVVYAFWATQSVLAADQGNARMQEIAGAIREGAQAYLTRQYTTIAMVGVVVFLAVWYLLSSTAAVGFMIGAVLSGLAGFIGMPREDKDKGGFAARAALTMIALKEKLGA